VRADDFISCSTHLSGSSISPRYFASAAPMTARPMGRNEWASSSHWEARRLHVRQFEGALSTATAFFFDFVWMDSAGEMRDDCENTACSALRPRARFDECGEKFMRPAPVQNGRGVTELQLTRMLRDIYACSMGICTSDIPPTRRSPFLPIQSAAVCIMILLSLRVRPISLSDWRSRPLCVAPSDCDLREAAGDQQGMCAVYAGERNSINAANRA